MKLIRCWQSYTYRSGRVTEYELLTRYNPRFINSKIQAMEYQINAMYSLNQSHVTCCDVRGMITVSYPLDKLVIWIIESKENLAYYKTASNKRLSVFKQVISHYSPQEQKAIIRYLASNGQYKPENIIEKLQVDLYRFNYNARVQRNIKRREARQKAVNEHADLIKQVLVNKAVAI